ncbi:MAG: Uma2 family endonuclease [Pyrinomonadaceae bacterium]|jgi:Uma2 family endonuclease|nr:Uma2 family endonuclease [Pyrinomonadaceae bacterium]
MEAVLDIKKSVINLPCEKIILHGISWQTYENLLVDNADNPNVRLFYDDGSLEIMTESFKHGNCSRQIEQIIYAIADELEIDFVSAGSTTFKKSKSKKGFEGDGSFYFKNADNVRGKSEIDLAIDVPPELVIEVDITNPSLPKFPIFASLEIEEIWRFDGLDVRFYRLQNAEYIEVSESVCLPKVESKVVTNLLESGFEMKRIDWLKLIRQSIQK